MSAILAPLLEHFHFFLFYVLVEQVKDHSAGEAFPLFLSTAHQLHQHASFNHLYIFIIHLPQAMNYSIVRFPHENSERRHEECLFPVFSLLSLVLSLFSLWPSLPLSHAALSLCHSENKDGDVLASRCLNVKTEAEVCVLLPKSNVIASKQIMLPVALFK